MNMSAREFSGDGLLGPHDPQVCQVFNARGRAPVVLLCDHASNHVPAALDGLGLGADELARHIAWDIGIDEVTRLVAANLEAPAVLAGYSRLVIDCNRALDDEQSIPEISDETPIPGNLNLSAVDRAARAEAFFHPYHRTAAATIDAVEKDGRTATVIMMHSFTPVLGESVRPWHVGVLWAEDGRLALPLLDRLRHHGDLSVGDNEPYSALSPRGYSMPVHASSAGRPGVQIEIRQDLIGDEAGGRAMGPHHDRRVRLRLRAGRAVSA